MKPYRPNACVRFGIPLIAIFLAGLLVRLPQQEFTRGGNFARYTMFSIAAVMLCLVVWAYINTATVKLRVTPAALEVSWIFAHRQVAWDAIQRVDWHHTLHCISIKDSNGVVAMFSTDGFPGWSKLVAEIHQRSECDLASNLRTLLIAKGLLAKPELNRDM